MLQDNSLLIHIKTGNILYANFNTNESFNDFLLAQQDENKKIIKKKISYAHDFKQYMQSFLHSFDYEEIDKFDLFTNKNSKYSYLESIHQQKNNKI